MAKVLFQPKKFSENEFKKLLKIEDLTEKIKQVESYRSTANSRIRRLAKANFLGRSQPYHDIFRASEREFFKKVTDEKDVNRLIANLSHFLTSSRTTKTGLKSYNERIEKARNTLNEKFRDNGSKVQIKDNDTLMRFFESDVYKDKRKYANSEELVEIFYEEYYDSQTDWNVVIKKFEDFANSEFSEAEIAYKKKKAEQLKRKYEKMKR